MHVGPTVVAPQFEHTVLAAPHALFASPGWHVPFVALEQQAPLHCWFVEHAVVHFFVVVLQAWPTGQLEAPKQPHEPLTHELPSALPAQSVHMPPVAPHLFV